MDIPTLLLAIGVSVAVLFFLEFWYRRSTRRLMDRMIADVRARVEPCDRFSGPTPESDFIVEVSDEVVRCTRPDGQMESVDWSDLQRVEILTTDEGPFVPDQFWVLRGASGGCVIPWGATGERQLLERLQKLPNFRNEAIVEVASLTTNDLQTCWNREG